MKISHNDIASIEPFGMMDGNPVNLVGTKGGLNLATMVDSKGDETVLGAASHRAILCYNLEQRFSSFQPILMKSEKETSTAESHSHFLSDTQRKQGYDIYSIQNPSDVDFIITKQNIKTGSAKGHVIGDLFLIKSADVSQEFVSALSGAISEKALHFGLKGVKVK